jgi:hypothetical protein
MTVPRTASPVSAGFYTPCAISNTVGTKTPQEILSHIPISIPCKGPAPGEQDLALNAWRKTDQKINFKANWNCLGLRAKFDPVIWPHWPPLVGKAPATLEVHLLILMLGCPKFSVLVRL